jgi:hypothetical protein
MSRRLIDFPTMVYSAGGLSGALGSTFISKPFAPISPA